MFKHILIPIDFRFQARIALITAARLAQEQNAAITLLYVQDLGRDIPPSPFLAITAEELEEMQRGVVRFLDDSAAMISEYGVTAATRLVRGSPVSSIIREVATSIGADLIVMGTHGRAGLAHAWWGSVTEDVVRGAEMPVLAVHEPTKQIGSKKRAKGIS